MKFLNRFLLACVVSALAFVSAPAQSTSNTIYQVYPDGLAQLTGTPGARVLRPTFAATVAVSPNLGIVHQIQGVSTTSATCTVTSASPGQFGQMMILICSADATGTVTYTLSTNLLPTATVVATASKAITVAFVSDGVAWHEFARSASAQ